MADKTAVIEASNIFSMGANFNVQSSSSDETVQYPQALDEVGDVACESGVNTQTNYTQDTVYCNSTPDIKTDLAAFLTQFGDVQGSKAVTGITIAFAAGEYATVSVEGHNHANNEHTELKNADISTAIPANAGFGCPDIWANSNTDATPVSVTVTASLNHVDREGADGNHWWGDNQTFLVTVTAEYINVPVLTTTGWQVESENTTDSNADPDGYSITAHKYFDVN